MKITPSQSKVLYALLHEIVRIRDGDRCLKCGKTPWQMSHIYPKGRYRRMEYIADNIKPLCFSCHICWWHKNPVEAHEWLQRAIPKERLDMLKMMSNTDMGRFDFKLHKLYLAQSLKRLINL